MEACKIGELENIQQRNHQIMDNLNNAISRLAKHREKLFGSIPGKLQGAENNVPCSPPAGMMGIIKDQAAEIVRKSEEIQVLITKLEDL